MIRIALAIVVATTAIAHADDDVIATQPLAIIGRGAEVSYEHRAIDRLSVVALGGVRAGAGEDMSSFTTTVGAELRYWPLRSMRALMIGLHASAARTSVSDAMGTLGSSTDFVERVDFGWRFVAWRHVAIMPALGLGASEDVDNSGRLATIAHPEVSLGLEVGWMR